MIILDRWKSFKNYFLFALFARAVRIKRGNHNDRISLEVRHIEVHAPRDGIRAGGKDCLHEPDHHGHVDENENGGRPFDEKIDKHIEYVLVFIMFVQVLTQLVRLSHHFLSQLSLY